jgi:hypothetical protein
MTTTGWPDYSLVLPQVPEALVFVVGLIITIALRRRLGSCASYAIGGFALLALAALGRIGWRMWLLSLFNAPWRPSADGLPEIRAGLKLSRDLDWPVNATGAVLYVVGLVCVMAALFMGRDRA